jgi:hypothetical protein
MHMHAAHDGLKSERVSTFALHDASSIGECDRWAMVASGVEQRQINKVRM